ncbi:DUF6640 family protein [Arthrobacter sp. B1805]|uniref:DUF6640 family protein n=1 Tax=Arthrobacter sp. B1805 TaxID=2058892 RepID=UPI0034D60C35
MMKPARTVLRTIAVATAVGGFIADWNRTHLFNPQWPPHARFHDAMSITSVQVGRPVWAHGDARGVEHGFYIHIDRIGEQHEGGRSSIRNSYAQGSELSWNVTPGGQHYSRVDGFELCPSGSTRPQADDPQHGFS